MKNIILKRQNRNLKEGHLGPVAARSARRALAQREADHDDAVRRLVAASFELIAETGSLEPSVAAIVNRAGLSNQAFYRHFRSKDELLLHARSTVLWFYGSLALAAMILRVLAEGPTPGDRLPYRAWMDYGGPLLMTGILLVTAYLSRSTIPS